MFPRETGRECKKAMKGGSLTILTALGHKFTLPLAREPKVWRDWRAIKAPSTFS
jgi:hypothetical protein